MINVRRKTETLEAVEVTKLEDAVEFCNARVQGSAARVVTRQGLVNALVGDYIVVAEDGTCEVYTPMEFSNTFEEVATEEE